jgi:hypothetical protein
MAERKTTKAKAAIKAATPKRTRRTATAATQDDIARRAYELWLAEPHSDALANWVRAERELVPA